jgi:PAS domain S-box-containing protein
MIVIDLIYNLALLVALSVVSGFIGTRWGNLRGTAVLQGLVFGSAAVIGMLNPLVLEPGLIFDGRSVAISLCGLFFGPLAAVVSAGMVLVCRFCQAGVETPAGVVLVIVISALMGIFFHARWIRGGQEVSSLQLLKFGLFGHMALLLLVFTLPFAKAIETLEKIGPPIILVYPLATVLIGRILSAQMARDRFMISLRENLEEFRTTLYSIGDAVIGTDTEGRIRHMNPVAEKLTGWPEAEALGQPVADIFRIISQDTRTPVENPVRRVLQENRKTTLASRTRLIARDGSECPIADSAAPIRDAAGKTRGAVLIFRDVTQEYEAAASLRASEAKFRTMVETIPLAIGLIAGTEQTIEYINPTMLRLFGYTRQEVPGIRQWWSLAYPEETYRQQVFEEWTRKVKRAIETQSPIEPMESVVTCKDGSKKNISWGYVVLGDNGYVYGLDLTARMQAEESGRRQEAKFRMLIEHLPQRIFFKDRHSVYISCNQPYANDLGIRPEEIAGKTDYDFHPPPFAEQYRADDRRIMDAGAIVSIEEKYRSGNEERWIRTMKIPCRDNAGTLIGIIGVFEDITERKQAEEALSRQADELKTRNDELNRFNQVAIGRETRMIELKREVNELCEKLGEATRYRIVANDTV